MDVRAPVEFLKGSFPTATNIPLLDDLQREQIGTRYKHAGQDEAIRLGNGCESRESTIRWLRAVTRQCGDF